MTCNYWVNNIEIPSDSVAKIKELQKEHGLEEEWPFAIVENNGVYELFMEDSTMSYGTCEGVDAFLDDVAKILANTKFDGQIIKYDYEGESIGYHVFIQGKRHEIGLIWSHLITLKKPSKVGQVYRETVELQVLGLPNKEIILVGP